RSIFMSLGSIDEKLFANVYKQQNANNFLSTNPRNIKILRLDTFCYSESNKPKSLNSNYWLLKCHDICACNNCLPIKIAILFYYMHKCHNVSITSDWNLMIFGLLDSL